MGKIVLLDELTINQIAAGEVIERPASVVKEMMENSIDAGATNITVEIKNGGISYIRITDNGKGIARDDVELAFERHATSKIRSSEDLKEVKSMGFRGEALASIAAISNVELISKTEDSEIGTKITVEGGDVLNIEDAACSKGTSITVRNLFYNTPVRYKFLKKDFTETGYIEDVITRIALVHPEIAIKLINTGKTTIQTNGNGDLKSVIYSIYGKEIAEEIIPVSFEYEYIKVNGVIGKPAIARSNRSNQIFFVNKRYIKDKTLRAAAEQAYKGMIPIGKFAFLILNLDMDPNKVDVNVHPAKLEVRFAEENVAFQAVYNAIKSTLLGSDLISDREKNKEIKEANKDAFKIDYNSNDGGLFGKRQSLDFNKTGKENKEQYISESTIISSENKEEDSENMDVFERLKKLQTQLQNQIDLNPQIKLTDDYKKMAKKYNEISSNAINIEENLKKEELVEDINEKLTENDNIEEEPIKTKTDDIEEEAENAKNNEIQETGEKKIKEVKEQILSFEEMYEKLFGKTPIRTKEDEKETKTEIENIENKGEYQIKDEDLNDNISVFEDIAEYKKTTYKFIGIAFKTYIILEMNDELYIMDQHAAHERILYEKVKKNFYSNKEKESQLLLLPDIITLTNKEMNIAKDNLSLFEKAGFIVEEFGENTLKVSGVPDVCVDLDTKELFMETLDEINTIARTAKQEKEEKFIATVACKAAVKANMALTEEEVTSLMDELLELPNPFSCPHGRPTVIKMSKYDIERKFARK